MLVTALPSIALSVGANRIVSAGAITHPVGSPGLDRDDEREYRMRVVSAALEMLAMDVDEQTMVEVRDR